MPVRVPSLGISERHAFVAEATDEKPSFILIEDAHTNSSAQQNIAAMLEELVPSQGIGTIFLEGGSGDDSLDELKAGSTPASRRVLGRELMARAQMQGADYFDLVSARNVRLWGVEDKALYAKALAAYRAAAEGRGPALSYLARMRQTLEYLMTRNFHPNLLAMVRARASYVKGEMPLETYFAELIRYAGWLNIDVTRFQSLRALSELLRQEKSLHFDRVTVQLNAFVGTLDEAGRDELVRLTQGARINAAAFAAGSKGPERAYFAFIESRLGNENGFGDLRRYLAYRRKAEAVEAGRTLSELDELDRRILRTLAVSDAEKELLTVAERLTRAEHMAQLSLSFEEFKAVRADASAHDVKTLGGVLNRTIAESGTDFERAIIFDSKVRRTMGKALLFYILADRRSGALLKNAFARMEGSGEQRAALVTGGFHVESLKEALKNENISYAVLTPRITTETNIARYEKVLLGNNTAARSGSADGLAVLPFRETPAYEAAAARLAAAPVQKAVIAEPIAAPARRARPAIFTLKNAYRIVPLLFTVLLAACTTARLGTNKIVEETAEECHGEFCKIPGMRPKTAPEEAAAEQPRVVSPFNIESLLQMKRTNLGGPRVPLSADVRAKLLGLLGSDQADLAQERYLAFTILANAGDPSAVGAAIKALDYEQDELAANDLWASTDATFSASRSRTSSKADKEPWTTSVSSTRDFTLGIGFSILTFIRDFFEQQKILWNEESSSVRYAAAIYLGSMADKTGAHSGAINALMETLHRVPNSDPNPKVRSAAAWALGRYVRFYPDAVSRTHMKFFSKAGIVKYVDAFEALGIAATQDPDIIVRGLAARAISSAERGSQDKRAGEYLAAVVNNEDNPFVIAVAAEGAGRYQVLEALQPILAKYRLAVPQPDAYMNHQYDLMRITLATAVTQIAARSPMHRDEVIDRLRQLIDRTNFDSGNISMGDINDLILPLEWSIIGAEAMKAELDRLYQSKGLKLMPQPVDIPASFTEKWNKQIEGQLSAVAQRLSAQFPADYKTFSSYTGNDLPVLTLILLGHQDAGFRALAAEKLRTIADPSMITILANVGKSDPDPLVRIASIRALTGYTLRNVRLYAGAADPLFTAMQEIVANAGSDARERAYAVRVLAQMGDSAALSAAGTALGDVDTTNAVLAMQLMRASGPQAAALVQKFLDTIATTQWAYRKGELFDTNHVMWQTMADALAEASKKNPDVGPTVLAALTNKIQQELGLGHDDAVIQGLLPLYRVLTADDAAYRAAVNKELSDANVQLTPSSGRTIASVKDASDAFDRYMNAVADENKELSEKINALIIKKDVLGLIDYLIDEKSVASRALAAKALGILGDPQSVVVLRERFLTDSDPTVYTSALRALAPVAELANMDHSDSLRDAFRTIILTPADGDRSLAERRGTETAKRDSRYIDPRFMPFVYDFLARLGGSRSVELASLTPTEDSERVVAALEMIASAGSEGLGGVGFVLNAIGSVDLELPAGPKHRQQLKRFEAAQTALKALAGPAGKASHEQVVNALKARVRTAAEQNALPVLMNNYLPALKAVDEAAGNEMEKEINGARLAGSQGQSAWRPISAAAAIILTLAVLAGNGFADEKASSSTPQDFIALAERADDNSEAKRLEAAEGLAKLGGTGVISPLRRLFASDASPAVRLAAGKGLASLEPKLVHFRKNHLTLDAAVAVYKETGVDPALQDVALALIKSFPEPAAVSDALAALPKPAVILPAAAPVQPAPAVIPAVTQAPLATIATPGKDTGNSIWIYGLLALAAGVVWRTRSRIAALFRDARVSAAEFLRPKGPALMPEPAAPLGASLLIAAAPVEPAATSKPAASVSAVKAAPAAAPAAVVPVIASPITRMELMGRLEEGYLLAAKALAGSDQAEALGYIARAKAVALTLAKNFPDDAGVLGLGTLVSEIAASTVALAEGAAAFKTIQSEQAARDAEILRLSAIQDAIKSLETAKAAGDVKTAEAAVRTLQANKASAAELSSARQVAAGIAAALARTELSARAKAVSDKAAVQRMSAQITAALAKAEQTNDASELAGALTLAQSAPALTSFVGRIRQKQTEISERVTRVSNAVAEANTASESNDDELPAAYASAKAALAVVKLASNRAPVQTVERVSQITAKLKTRLDLTGAEKALAQAEAAGDPDEASRISLQAMAVFEQYRAIIGEDAFRSVKQRDQAIRDRFKPAEPAVSPAATVTSKDWGDIENLFYSAYPETGLPALPSRIVVSEPSNWALVRSVLELAELIGVTGAVGVPERFAALTGAAPALASGARLASGAALSRQQITVFSAGAVLKAGADEVQLELSRGEGPAHIRYTLNADRSITVTGLGEAFVIADPRRVLADAEGNAAAAALSLSDTRLYFRQARSRALPLDQAADLLTDTPVILTLDLGWLDNRDFIEYHLPVLLEELRTARKNWYGRNVVYVATGRNAALFAEKARELLGPEQALIFTSTEDIDPSFRAKAVRASIGASQAAGQFNVIVESLGEGDTPDFSSLLKAAAFESRLGTLSADNPAFLRFKGVYESMLGRSIDDLAEFVAVLTGRAQPGVSSRYAIPKVAKIDFSDLLKARRLLEQLARAA